MEKELREQLAKQIEDACKDSSGMYCGLTSNYQCSCSEAADLVRGK